MVGLYPFPTASNRPAPHLLSAPRSLIDAPRRLLGLGDSDGVPDPSHNDQRLIASSFRSLRCNAMHGRWPRVWDRCCATVAHALATGEHSR